MSFGTGDLQMELSSNRGTFTNLRRGAENTRNPLQLPLISIYYTQLICLSLEFPRKE
jgi:hypothetical protein